VVCALWGVRCRSTVDAAGRWPLDQQVENLLYGRPVAAWCGGRDDVQGVVPCPLEPLPGFGPCGGRLSGGTAIAEPPATLLSPFRAANCRSNAVGPVPVEFRIPEPLGIQSKATVRKDPAITRRERGPLCPPRWAFVGRSPSQWAENKFGSAQPPSVGRPTEHLVRQGPETGWRGGGPLCPLRLAFVGRRPSRWAENNLGSAQPFFISTLGHLSWFVGLRH
jgi:hypothetical protein